MGHYYTKHGYAMVSVESASPHRFGGKNYHKGAICPVCKIPLLLLADIDCVSFRKIEEASYFLNWTGCRFITVGNVALKSFLIK